VAPPTATGDARRLIGIGLAVVVAYVIAARLGFRLAFVAEQITTVWAPTGIAQAALLLWGRSLWPAIWLGAFVTNAGTEAPLWTAAAVAAGNTLEAVVAAWTFMGVLAFTGLLLAAAIAERRTSERSQLNHVVSLAGCRALVVDDEEDARELIATILTTAGANVRTAASVREALRHLDASRPDVLLADIGMPGTDGYSLIREVRRREAQTGQRLPAAAITAYAGTQDRERALAAGFDRHVPKPISPAAIVEAVLSMCRGSDHTS
jgi:CheY-like chemotaxis protein